MPKSSSFARALLNVDSNIDRLQKENQQNEAIEARENEKKKKSLWSTIGKVALGAAFGPVGIVAGDLAGRAIVDISDDSESKKITKTKFRASETSEFNKGLKRYDDKQFFNDAISVGGSAISAFQFGGGFNALAGKEGVGAIGNADYWTKWGGDKMGLFEFMQQGGGNYFEYLKKAGKDISGQAIKAQAGNTLFDNRNPSEHGFHGLNPASRY